MDPNLVLAEAISALINAKPRSPSVQEIYEAIESHWATYVLGLGPDLNEATFERACALIETHEAVHATDEEVTACANLICAMEETEANQQAWEERRDSRDELLFKAYEIVPFMNTRVPTEIQRAVCNWLSLCAPDAWGWYETHGTYWKRTGECQAMQVTKYEFDTLEGAQPWQGVQEKPLPPFRFAKLQPPQPGAISFHNDGVETLRITADGITANPDVSIDAAAQAILNALSGNIKEMVEAEVKRRLACLGLELVV